jgi:transcriptional repressor NrdR
MQCPYCTHNTTSVLDSRVSEEAIRRRRECDSCSKRFTTYERVELLDLAVVKKDGRREPFDRQKLVRGIMRACEKRPVTTERIKRVVDEVELAVRQHKTEIPSRKVGELVMAKLKTLDAVAYVRFASVYRRFTDASQFAEEVAKLKNAGALKPPVKTKRGVASALL